MYTTARSFESQVIAKEDLDYSRKITDESLDALYSWPGRPEDGQLFRSPHLFAAVLDKHRSQVKVGNYFWDELQFYTNIIDVIFGWLNRELGIFSGSDVWKWLLAYSYLMGGINYLGAEQALCSAFYSIICFSHRETFFYANFSFSGEAVFRLYRQAYPDDREGIWRITPHQHFFPDLHTCREEIFADMDYHGMSMDPSLCDYARKNETRFSDLELLTGDENEMVLTAINSLLQRDSNKALFDLMFSALVFTLILCYVVVIHLCRCVCIKCHQARRQKKWRQRKQAELIAEEDKMIQDHLALQQTSTMIKFDDFNCKGPNSIHVKVATV